MPEQVLHRVVAEEGGEQRADRRQRGDRPPRSGQTPWAAGRRQRRRQRDGQPAIISEKKMPIDSDVPELKNVPRMPDAAPRWLAGTLFMIAVVFGAENSPEPMPLSASSAANCQ